MLDARQRDADDERGRAQCGRVQYWRGHRKVIKNEDDVENFFNHDVISVIYYDRDCRGAPERNL